MFHSFCSPALYETLLHIIRFFDSIFLNFPTKIVAFRKDFLIWILK